MGYNEVIAERLRKGLTLITVAVLSNAEVALEGSVFRGTCFYET